MHRFFNPNSLEEVKSQGFENLEEFRDTGRNVIYTAMRENQKFAIKINRVKLPEKMEQDIWWCMTIQRVNAVDPTFPVRAPNIVAFGTGWHATEWIEHEGILVEQEKPTAKSYDPHCNELVGVLVALDNLRFAVDTNEPTRTAEGESAPFDQLDRKLDEWKTGPLADGCLTQERLEKARQLILRYQSNTQPALQHGDFVPWHFFESKGKLVLIDGEHASLHKPRYYDLAYLYTRVFTRIAPESACNTLAKFLEQSAESPEQVEEQLIPVMTLRALGMHTDAVNDLEREDYRSRAQELLDRCFKEDIMAFTE